ncbi:MAG: GerMN domain-containing protein [Fusobacteriaceae bacterium]
MKKLLLSVSVFLSLGIFLGVFYEKQEQNSKIVKEINFKIEDSEKKSEEKMKYTIYLPSKKYEKLNMSEEEFNYTENKNEITKEIVEKIIMSLKNNKMILDNIKLKNIFLKENEIYLNFSNWKERDEEKNLYIIYAITNSLVDALGQKKVKILIDGEESEGVFKEYYEKNLNI